MKNNKHGLESAILGLVVLVMFGALLSIIFRSIGIDRIRELVNQSGVWGPVMFITLHAATVIISPFGGGGVLTLSAEPLFGFWFGMLYFILGGMLGSAINFWVARIFGQKIIENLIGEKKLGQINSLAKIITDKNPIILIPLLSTSLFNFFCYAAGLTDIKFSKFYQAVIITSLINTPIYIGIASNIIQPSDFTKYFFLTLVSMALLAFAIEEFVRRNKNIQTPKIILEIEEVAKEIKKINL